MEKLPITYVSYYISQKKFYLKKIKDEYWFRGLCRLLDDTSIKPDFVSGFNKWYFKETKNANDISLKSLIEIMQSTMPNLLNTNLETSTIIDQLNTERLLKLAVFGSVNNHGGSDSVFYLIDYIEDDNIVYTVVDNYALTITSFKVSLKDLPKYTLECYLNPPVTFTDIKGILTYLNNNLIKEEYHSKPIDILLSTYGYSYITSSIEEAIFEALL